MEKNGNIKSITTEFTPPDRAASARAGQMVQRLVSQRHLFLSVCRRIWSNILISLSQLFSTSGKVVTEVLPQTMNNPSTIFQIDLLAEKNRECQKIREIVKQELSIAKAENRL